MWKAVTQERSDSSHSSLSIVPTKSYYIRKFKSFHRRQKLREEEDRLRVANELRFDIEMHVDTYYLSEISETRCSFIMLGVGYGRIYEWLVLFGLIFTTITTALKLDGVIDWSWWIVFIPFYFMILQLIYLPLMYDLASLCYHRV
jgi:hypothetical protein